MKLMQLVYPNLSVHQYGAMMQFVFWLFTGTTVFLALCLLAVKVGTVSPGMVAVAGQAIGPILAINVALLCFLANQDFRASQPD